MAGVTDMIDGPIARRLKATSQSGAIIDSVADMVFVGFIILLPVMGLWAWLLLSMYIALAYKVGSGLIGYIKHREMVLLHTYGNKLLALFLFSIPIVYYFVGASLFVNIYTLFGMVCIFVITTEEILINLLLSKPNRDIQSIFQVKAVNEALLKAETAASSNSNT
jgi:CDP-diacylglycerol--glycerol-3-phosphate 3-phosphatidyltransferase